MTTLATVLAVIDTRAARYDDFAKQQAARKDKRVRQLFENLADELREVRGVIVAAVKEGA